MRVASKTFSLPARILHWLMAVLILGMLFVGVGMVSSVAPWQITLVAIHKVLGLLLLALVVIRLGVRLACPPPPLPADLPGWQKVAAQLSHWLLYLLMFAQPLIGLAMQSAGGYPLLVAGVALPTLLAPDPELYGLLRLAHSLVGFALFATILLHLGAALFHAWVRRDEVLSSMLGKGQR
jgi:cytochrome b561